MNLSRLSASISFGIYHTEHGLNRQVSSKQWRQIHALSFSLIFYNELKLSMRRKIPVQLKRIYVITLKIF